ncbi:MAG: HAD-IA family hydrolase [Rhizomicrobium sp.]|nr:HAD-IA family hydrolase [Rhizomicrobium sp.]
MTKPVIIFDLDGTLVDTAPDLLASINWLLGREGRPPVAEEQLRRLVGRGAKNLIAEAFLVTGDPVSPFEIEMLYRAFLQNYGSHVADNSLPYPGVMATLEALQAEGFVLGVLTNKPHAPTTGLLDALGMTDFFGAIYGQGKRAYMKPDPRLFAEIQGELGGGPALMVGDSITDVETARAAGVPVILVPYGYTQQPASSLGADVVVEDFTAVPVAAKQLLGL